VNRVRSIILGAVALTVLASATACAEIAPPDKVGLFYLEGQSDGYKFGHCIDPGTSDDWVANNSVAWVPSSVRTWNIAKEGGDSKTPITVNTKPEESQPSGVQVNVWTLTNLALNTSCEGGKDSPLVQWWEKIGRRYKADTDAGWVTMLQNTVVPALETATRNVARAEAADPLVAGVNNPEVQTKIAAEFAKELKRVVGGDYFCGPTFNRADGKCPPVEVILKDVDYTDAGIQDARNQKVKALELAAALVAEAEGKVRAAQASADLYKSPAWLELEKLKVQLEMVKACTGNCTFVVSPGGVITATK